MNKIKHSFIYHSAHRHTNSKAPQFQLFTPMNSTPPQGWRILHSEASLGWGGQEHRVMAELTGFQQRGCSVSLLAHPRSQIMARARAAGIPTHACPFDRRLLPFEVLRLALWLRRAPKVCPCLS